eukprot:gnl/TRDRNA2_/TRDRNA2_198198_c0_seq1.p1 gnl/TRDRNA2_/TRDRNA2_198198_c0~~gnl/TRDRNA2_/TRDRNA2_198198_c0_seq1.p1  ORF type:complete len:402 (+),score=39.26 gnl/TRDRNA2_/TRDRNA2_198198_c0_seq1:67-1272(+)
MRLHSRETMHMRPPTIGVALAGVPRRGPGSWGGVDAPRSPAFRSGMPQSLSLPWAHRLSTPEAPLVFETHRPDLTALPTQGGDSPELEVLHRRTNAVSLTSVFDPEGPAHADRMGSFGSSEGTSGRYFLWPPTRREPAWQAMYPHVSTWHGLHSQGRSDEVQPQRRYLLRPRGVVCQGSCTPGGTPGSLYVSREGHPLADCEAVQDTVASQEMCAICLDVLQPGDLVQPMVGCRHLFHQGCIQGLVQADPTGVRMRCPLCRGPLAAASLSEIPMQERDAAESLDMDSAPRSWAGPRSRPASSGGHSFSGSLGSSSFNSVVGVVVNTATGPSALGSSVASLSHSSSGYGGRRSHRSQSLGFVPEGSPPGSDTAVPLRPVESSDIAADGHSGDWNPDRLHPGC